LITLPIGGFYRYRHGGEKHAFEAKSIHMLQSAVGNKNYSLYKKYSQMIDEMPPINIRDLLGYQKDTKKTNLTEVQSAQDIRKRLVAPGFAP
jgi:glutamate synthase (NADPH/NADH) large chain